MARRQKLDRTEAIQMLAKLTSRYLANDEDTENNRKLSNLEELLKQQYPNEWKKIDRVATNLALGHREA